MTRNIGQDMDDDVFSRCNGRYNGWRNGELSSIPDEGMNSTCAIFVENFEVGISV